MSEWKTIDEGRNAITERLKVPGGWLYWVSNDRAKAASLCFVPEPDKCQLHNEYTYKVCQSCLKPEKDPKLDLLFTEIDKLDLVQRSKNILRSEDVFLIGDLICNKKFHSLHGNDGFLRGLKPIPNCGSKTIREIEKCLESIGLTDYYECPQYWEIRKGNQS